MKVVLNKNSKISNLKNFLYLLTIKTLWFFYLMKSESKANLILESYDVDITVFLFLLKLKMGFLYAIFNAFTIILTSTILITFYRLILYD